MIKNALLIILTIGLNNISQAQMTKIVPNNHVGDRPKVGFSCAAHLDWILVGGTDDDAKLDNNGAVWVFKRNPSTGAITQEAKLLPDVGNNFFQFGESVATNGTEIAVGCTNGNDVGQTFIFTRSGNTWTQTAKVSGDARSGFFGTATQISSKYLIIGANRENRDMTVVQTGAVYFYDKSGNAWNKLTKLTSPNRITNGLFGNSISLEGERVVIGAPGDKGTGQAYVYLRSGNAWNLEATLSATDLTAGDFFGGSVSLKGDLAAVGAIQHNAKGAGSGAVYIYRRNGTTWSQVTKIFPADGDAGDNFGDEVAVLNGYVVVTAPADEEKGSFTGTGYVYKQQGNSWVLDQKVFSLDPNNNEVFGISLGAANNGTLVFGATGDNASGVVIGAAYVLKLNVSVDNKELIELSNNLDIFPNPATDVLNVQWNGIPQKTANEFRILDLSGKVLMDGQVNLGTGDQIQISQLPRGVFILELSINGLRFGKQFLHE